MGRTVVLDIRNGNFPHLSIPPGTHVVWRNLDPVPHSAETENSADMYFNAGPLLPGEVSPPVYFANVAEVPYRCRYHAGMTGTVSVRADAPRNGTITLPKPSHDHGGHSHGFNHLHGFVTGGRSGSRFYMAHTPVLADPRHRYQVILRGSLIQPDHMKSYNDLRSGSYGDRRIQIFHEHTSLPDIRDRKITELPRCSFAYYPDIAHPDEAADVPGLGGDIPVKIEAVVHFHTFDVDEEPEDHALEYLVYGDDQDVFIDHFMNRGPSFHSVAKLAEPPAFWKPTSPDEVKKVKVPGKRIEYLAPKVVQRIAFVDNSFHIFWLPPSGLYAPAPLDPLFPRKGFNRQAPSEFKGGPFPHEVLLEDGSRSSISVGRALHFDLRLLNHGVFLPDNA
ncbi:hypothetical protein HJA85_25165 [Rhizobium bangladeshense]|uniref:cupredoxin domain-containing protein n=1 Tax=Rhizobium bangladeshense TaxID=1138189 RepID=UPI001C83FDC4|nr:hypothetical protein [Rhizobium bangladeshense]MBX4870231.1 hypothetical protein [Rhizobium bangladeshense]